MSNIQADEDDNVNETDSENTEAEATESGAQRLNVPERSAMLQRDPVIKPR